MKEIPNLSPVKDDQNQARRLFYSVNYYNPTSLSLSRDELLNHPRNQCKRRVTGPLSLETAADDDLSNNKRYVDISSFEDFFLRNL